MMPILVTSVVSIVSVPLYFHVLGDQMYAMWFYVATLTGAFGFMDLGLGATVGRYIGVSLGAKDERAVQEYWSTGNIVVLPLVFLFAVVFVILGIFWVPQWFKVTGDDATMLRWAMLWSSFSLFFNYYGQMWNILTMTFLDFKYVSLLRVYFSLSSTLGAIVVALIFKNVAALTAFFAVLACLQFLILFLRGTYHYNMPIKLHEFRMARLKEMLPYTLKTFAQLISGSVIGSLDRLFLGRIAPASDFAGFNVSLNIASRLGSLSVAVMQPVFCNTARGVGGDLSRSPAAIYRESMAMVFPWYSLIAIGAAFWSVPAITVWLDPKNAPAVIETFPWIVVAISLNSVANISGAQLGGLDRVGLGLFIQSVSSILSLAGVIIGWMLAGIHGAAIGFCLARLIWIAQDFFVRRIIEIPFAEYALLLRILIRQLTIVGLFWISAQWMASTPMVHLFFGIGSALVAASIEIALQLKQKQLSSCEI